MTSGEIILYININVNMSVCIYIYIHTHICLYVYVHIHVYVFFNGLNHREPHRAFKNILLRIRMEGEGH